MKISVIIPFYKELNLIERAVKSVFDQIIPNEYIIEAIIGNDSPYSEAEIRSQLSETSNEITFIAKNNGPNGAGSARNAAIEISTGDYLAFLDADDYWLQGKISSQISEIKKGANFISTKYAFKNTNTIISPPSKVKSTYDLLCNTTIGTSTILITRDLLGDSRFRNLKTTQDTDLWARLAGKSNFKYSRCDILGTIYSPSERTSNKLKQLTNYRKILNDFEITLFQKIIILTRYSLRGVINHYIRK